jgi:DNA-binding MarR family transcriptional regulator
MALPAPLDPSAQRNIETQVWQTVLEMHGEIFNRLNRALGREFGITLAKFDVLAQLHRFRDGMTQGVLSRHLKVTGGNVTGLVRRLAAGGLITREMSATDRRAFIVRLTPQGAAVYSAARDRHDALLREWFSPIAPDEVRRALQGLSVLTRHIGSSQPTS